MKYLRILYVQVIIGIALGVLAGYLFPSFAPTAKLISELFINMIKMVIAPVVFFTLVLGIAGAGDLKKVGRVGGKAIIYFEIITTLAIIIGVLVANWIKPGAGIPATDVPPIDGGKPGAPENGLNWIEFIAHIIPANVVEAFAKGDIIQILFFGILFSIGLNKLGAHGAPVISMFEKLNKVLFNILHMVMKVSPVGAFGGMAYTIGKFGFGSLALLGKLLMTYYLTSLLFIFVVLNGVLKYYGFSLWKLLGYVKAELLIVFGASSSEAVLPNIIEKLEYAGCDKTVVGLVVPAGYSFNLDGTSIYLSMSVIFLAQVFNVPLSIGHQLSIIGILLIASKGAAGVTGSGFLVLTSTLTALKIIPLEGLALLIGVDRFMSEGRAITNFIGNTVATVILAKSEKGLDIARYKFIVEKVPYDTDPQSGLVEKVERKD
ncbi:MAG TPA: C4-dicarboxylate transporter DctA [Chitinophagaceae bacterium]|nr:C4-dicarboxylate transporter DctA [Chitinophagaceae bacterium]